MDRLTSERVNGIKTGYWSPSKKQDLVDRLAEYENTGLMPNEIKDKLEALQIYQSIGLTPDQIRWMLDRECWISVEEKVPDSGIYIFLSFTNFTLPMIGRYEKDSDGGAFYIGDEGETCVSQDLYVNAWRPLPEPYRPERNNHDR